MPQNGPPRRLGVVHNNPIVTEEKIHFESQTNKREEETNVYLVIGVFFTILLVRIE